LDSRMGYGSVCITLPHWEWAAGWFEQWAATHSERPYKRLDNPGLNVVFSFGFEYVIFRPALAADNFKEYSMLVALDADLDQTLYSDAEGDNDDNDAAV